ncbi:flagellar basal-body rod modification protein FlgD [Gracilibacillus orientalis]|uniref:Flagellar basal-body rod modification protein FlgD n=1 Tax=Gracilibacillus orientalis TaxID=334253 RepID=A0A1I4PWL5_9BACI|nr:flagellar hook assembly protein FlgD [Gracilibacillus orientalis]SFM32198.1 flagellar basal-body rod modification protein FlgD [Gracilibacillus orientalis]
MTSIDPSYYLSKQNQAREANNSLGKEEFLKILMSQLQNQDPLNPMEDKEFISQMTTFSSLEQMMNMSNSIDTLVKNQTVSPVIQYSHLIGKEVSYYRLDEETGEVAEPKEIVSSEVKAISQQDGYAVIELDGEQKIYTDEVLRINDPSAE